MKIEILEQQPESWEFYGTDDIFIKQMPLAQAGMIVPQHSHTYDHYTMLATGSMRVIKDGVLVGDFWAPTAIFIERGCKHTLISLEPNTLAYCLHNLHGMATVGIESHHELGEA